MCEENKNNEKEIPGNLFEMLNCLRKKHEENTMAIELHHLHPGHDDELSRLKARIAELEKENQTLAEDVSDKIESITELMELVEKYKSEKAELEEERRWRKFSEEKPEKGQKVLFRAKYKTDNVRIWIGEFRCVYGEVFYTSAPGWGCEFLPKEIFGWMPQPSTPKEKK